MSCPCLKRPWRVRFEYPDGRVRVTAFKTLANANRAIALELYITDGQVIHKAYKPEWESDRV